MTQLDADTFTRSNTAGNTTISNAAGWGTASGGSVWANDAGAYTYSINSNVGKITGDAVSNTMYLGSTSVTNGDIKVRIKQDHAADRAGVTLRRSSTNNFYRAELVSGTTLSLFKNVAGTTTQIGSNITFNYTTAQLTWIRFRLQGTSLAAKAWLDGNSEPDWMITATDSSLSSAGNFGLNVKLNAGADVVTFDSLVINDLGAAYVTQTADNFITSKSLKTTNQHTFITEIANLNSISRERFIITYFNQDLYSDTFTGSDGLATFGAVDGLATFVGIG